jgi:hypothetical protein
LKDIEPEVEPPDFDIFESPEEILGSSEGQNNIWEGLVATDPPALPPPETSTWAFM